MSVASEPPRRHWLNPLNKLIITKAVKARHAEVTLLTGHKLDIQYHGNKIWIFNSYHDDFVPCGWFSLKAIYNLTWLDAEEK